MISNNEETEIKIEYFNSLDLDPLRENHEKIVPEICMKSDRIFTNLEHNNQIIGHKRLENETTWYRSINNTGRYLCNFCESTYSTVQTLRHHVRIKHMEHYNQLKTKISNRKHKPKCHICKKYYKITTELQDHLKIHDIENIKISCSICHALLQNDFELSNHMLNEHGCTKKPKHFCNICGYSTYKLSHFKQHNNTHNENNIIKCMYCDYSTNYSPNLKIHERTHTNYRPYSCPVKSCGYTCTAKSALYSHSLKHSDGRKLFYCDKCGYNTVYKQSLKKHIDSHKRNSIRLKFQT